jgi:hypothetical protein
LHATARARRAAKRLIRAAERGEDVVLLAHGFFNAMIGRELKRLGWRRVSTQGYRYWCGQRFERDPGLKARSGVAAPPEPSLGMSR